MDLIKKLKNWAEFIQKTRNYFNDNGYLEVFTKQIVEAGAFEHSLDCLKVSGTHISGELHTSPEIEMKKLLSQTGLSLYQICKSFRDDPTTEYHLQEFTMLEFYKVGANHIDILNETKKLMLSLDPKIVFKQMTMEEALKEKTGFALSDIKVEQGDTWEDAFFKIWLSHVETKFDPNTAVIITHFPAALSALGKIGKDNFVERFEIYWKNMEICNGCTELNNLEILDERYKIESEFRINHNKKPHRYPDTLKWAFQNNFPDCAGVCCQKTRCLMYSPLG
jgi:lysyl-tRNA synthetase class 2